MIRETVAAVSRQACIDAKIHPSGTIEPDNQALCAGKYFLSRNFGRLTEVTVDVPGGLVVTGRGDTEWENQETDPLLERYLKGRADIPTEHRSKMMKLIEDLTASRYAGWLFG